MSDKKCSELANHICREVRVESLRKSCWVVSRMTRHTSWSPRQSLGQGNLQVDVV